MTRTSNKQEPCFVVPLNTHKVRQIK